MAGAVGLWVVAKLAFVIFLGAGGTGQSLTILSQFDAYWFAGVMELGYQWPTTGDSPLSNLAFFPLFPTVAGWVALLGFTPQQALIVVAVLGSVAAVLGIQRVGAVVASDAAGMWLAFLWAVAPRSHVQLMGYSEGPFTALVAWSVWALLTERPLLAGTLAFFAGLTRPSVLPVILVFGVVWLATAWRHRGEGPVRALFTKELAAAVLSGLGFLGYWLYVAARTGHFFGYFQVQAVWNTTLASVVDTARFVVEHVLPYPEHWRVRHAILFAVMLYLGLFVCMLIKRIDWRLTLFVGAGLLLTLSQQGYFHSYARFLLPLFPLWLPLAMSMTTWPRWLRWTVALAAVAASAAWGVDTALMRNSP